jgi:hypothetical protein
MQKFEKQSLVLRGGDFLLNKLCTRAYDLTLHLRHLSIGGTRFFLQSALEQTRVKFSGLINTCPPSGSSSTTHLFLIISRLMVADSLSRERLQVLII